MTEGLLYLLVIFTPWAFGTTQTWSIWTANGIGYALGVLLLAKWAGRKLLSVEDAVGGGAGGRPTTSTVVLGALTLVLLAYVAVSALNARADYDPVRREFEYFERYVRWLPHSYDRGATWAAFAQYLALAGVFWSIRDWLLGGGGREVPRADRPAWAGGEARMSIPPRLRRLLWVLCLNAALLAMVGVLQRADGTNRLLWMIESRSNKPADAVFGPWSYRANAAQYFNLLWPVCLAFWLWSQECAGRAVERRQGRFDGPQILLLPCAVALAACPMISASRGGALVGVALGGLAVLAMLLVSRREISPLTRRLTLGTVVVAGLAGVAGGWTTIRDRLSRPDQHFASGFQAGTNDFTLLLRVHLPDQADGQWHTWVALGGHGRFSWHPHALFTGLAANGGIVAQVLGSATTNISRAMANDTLGRLGNREVLLAFVRQGGMRIFADGVELPAVEGGTGSPPGWGGFIHTRYLFAQHPDLTEVALVPHALTAEELAALAAASSLESLGTTLRAELPLIEGTEVAAAVSVADGVVAENTTRRADPSRRWLTARRSEGPGPLAVRWDLEGVDPRLRSSFQAAGTVWNPGTLPCRLMILVDGAAGDVVDVPARTEQAFRLAGRSLHSGAARELVLALADEWGTPLNDVSSGTEIFLRDLRLGPPTPAFRQALVREFRLVNLADRMSGRGEVYANARRMLQDYPVWGSGAGTFTSLYQLYLRPGQDWVGYLHNDWGETRITLGGVGLGLVVAGWLVLAWRSWRGHGVPAPRVILVLWWLGPLGCLVHARFDFPFQVYSVMCLFVVLTAVLTVLTAGRPAGR